MRKGISPMIGIVLSLGFVIVLTAVIFTFTRGTVEDEISGISESELESYCLLHVNLEVSDACYSNNKVEMTVKNNGDSKVDSSTSVRFSGTGNCVVNFPPDVNLNAFESKNIELDIGEGCGVPSSGEIIPYIEIEGGVYSCGVEDSFSVASSC